MEMNQSASGVIEDVTLSEILGLATWDRPRSHDELVDFINRHSSILIDED